MASEERNLDLALREVTQDLVDLGALLEDAHRRLTRFRSGLRAHPQWGRAETRLQLRPIVDQLLASYAQALEMLQAPALQEPEAALRQLGARKRQLVELARSMQGMTGAVLASLEWQSPAFLHAAHPQAGQLTGRVNGTINDYRRDHHAEAEAYEQAFRRAYVDCSPVVPPQICAASSGMAAFATIVASVAAEKKFDGPVLVGQSSYFENRGVLNDAFRDRVVLVDEHDTEGILEQVRTLKPGAIFLDTLCNDPSMAMPDIATLVPALARGVERETCLVLDNTGLAAACQPLALMPLLSKLRLVVFESLNKFHQYGFDRVTGGMMWTVSGGHVRLFGRRMHWGTNLPDASALSLPTPDRGLLLRRLARHGRNALTVAQALDEHVRGLSRSPLSHVVYPGLPSHPSHAWTKDRPFAGAFLLLAFKPEHERASLSQSLLALVIDEARKAGADVNAGSSFGLDTTRVYVTAVHARDLARPFFRISLGTENAAEVATLVGVFTRAIDRLSSRLIY